MKTFTKISMIVFAMILAAQVTNAQQQIPFQGMVSQGYGVAAWNANGTGPEPAATGHQVPFPGFGNLFYYGASRDYVTGNSNHACFAFSPDIAGFPNFTQALTTNGYTANQVKARFGLVTLGLDEEGLDWFVMDDFHHSSHKYSDFNIFELNGEPMLAMKIDYAVWTVQNGTTTWIIDFGYTPVINISGSSSAGVQAVAQAFLADLDGKSIRLQCESNYGGMTITGNGRNGALYNIINGTLTVGNPTLPFKGLYADNEGFAGWDADGTGPEPFGNGHDTQLYYGASLDYGGINANPDACLGHLLEGSSGFQNTLLQLQYRGIDIGSLKMKLGLSSLGPDVFGEDWGYENGRHWCNYYNNHLLIELEGEPIMKVMADTNKAVFMNTYWKSGASVGKVYDISENASPAAKYVAQSFQRDMGSHYLSIITDEMLYVGPFSGNGRDGGIYQIPQGRLTGVHKNITFVPFGEVSGIWTAEGSPYYVDGYLEIANGETLTIEPGVKVAVRGPYHFTVQGCVKAEGTVDSNIVFTRSNPNLWWDGFDYDFTPATNDTSLFQHCTFKYSNAMGEFPYNSGGAFAIREFNKIRIENSVFSSNEAMYISSGYSAGGGAIALWNANPKISHCLFRDNHARFGGAIFLYDNSNPMISRCLFYNNTSVSEGGAIEIWGNSHPDLINNSFALNHAGTKGGAVDIYELSNPVMVNNIFWGNTASQNPQISITSSGCNPTVKYSNVQGGQAGIGPYAISAANYKDNIDADPLFQDVSLFNFMLDEFAPSPCINAGDPSTPPDPGGSRADMGCFYQDISTGIINHQNPEYNVSIHPVPFVDKLHILFELSEPSDISIYIYNSLGALMTKADYGKMPSGKQEKQWNASSLPDGVYMLMVEINEKRFTRKALKTK